MELLKLKSRGEDVKKWQFFLIGQDLLNDIADGIFGPKTDAATKVFQEKYKLYADGIVGRMTYAKAMEIGFPAIEEPTQTAEKDYYWMPPEPNFTLPVSNEQKFDMFGKFTYQIIDNDGNIKITNNWAMENIIKINIPQLLKIQGSGDVYFHKLGAEQLKSLFSAWGNGGLLNKILTWHGSYVPRMIRGSKTDLSNHAFGTAFDINYRSNDPKIPAWNGLGMTPAYINETGSVRELVPLANKFGFYWGGHYKRRPDGMHFEFAKIL